MPTVNALTVAESLVNGGIYDGYTYGYNANQLVCSTFITEVLDHQDLQNSTLTSSQQSRINVNLGGADFNPLVENNDISIQGAPQCIVENGWGVSITLAQMQPGDFIQYWTRNSNGVWYTGHSVIAANGDAGLANAPCKNEDGSFRLYGFHSSTNGPGYINVQLQDSLTGLALNNRRVYISRYGVTRLPRLFFSIACPKVNARLPAGGRRTSGSSDVPELTPVIRSSFHRAAQTFKTEVKAGPDFDASQGDIFKFYGDDDNVNTLEIFKMKWAELVALSSAKSGLFVTHQGCIFSHASSDEMGCKISVLGEDIPYGLTIHHTFLDEWSTTVDKYLQTRKPAKGFNDGLEFSKRVPFGIEVCAHASCPDENCNVNASAFLAKMYSGLSCLKKGNLKRKQECSADKCYCWATLSREDISSLTKLNWSSDGLLRVSACNSGVKLIRGWSPASEFSKQQSVDVEGEVGWSFFSEDNENYITIDNGKDWEDNGLIFGWGAFANPSDVTTGSVYLRAYNRGGNSVTGTAYELWTEATGIPLPASSEWGYRRAIPRFVEVPPND